MWKLSHSHIFKSSHFPIFKFPNFQILKTMNKTLLVLQREYLTRVKKKSFIILTLLIPFIFAAIALLPAYLATIDDTKNRTIAVLDESELLIGRFNDLDHAHFHFIPREKYDELIENSNNEFYAILYIPANIKEQNEAILTSPSQIPIDIKSSIDRSIEKIIETDNRAFIIRESNIPDLEERLAAAKTNITINTIKVGTSGEVKQTSTEIAMGLGYIGGFLIYMFIFMYGTMVMRGVMEEKQNRIVEVIASSVKPFNLMMGKILGVALVGLTQIAIWIFLFSIISMIAQGILFSASDFDPAMAQQMLQQQGMALDQPQNKAQEIMIWLGNMNFPLIIFSFVFYFFGGYLLYSSLMGAIGAAVDSEEDTQQFILPVTAPLIISMIVLINGIQNPEGPLAFWFSIIPFTSPVMMMVRIPFDPPVWQIALSMFLLVITFMGTVWMAAKIYRTGILMYGKKISYKELWKWLRY